MQRAFMWENMIQILQEVKVSMDFYFVCNTSVVRFPPTVAVTQQLRDHQPFKLSFIITAVSSGGTW